MNKYLKLSLISVVVSTFLISCGEPDYSDDGSSYVSGNGYYGSCYSAATATCGYYFDMTSSEYTNMRSQCSNWFDSNNVCDGNTQNYHRQSDPNSDSYTQICEMDTRNSNSHLTVYKYGFTITEARNESTRCRSYGGRASIGSAY
jgi:hypothetical protein